MELLSLYSISSDPRIPWAKTIVLDSATTYCQNRKRQTWKISLWNGLLLPSTIKDLTVDSFSYNLKSVVESRMVESFIHMKRLELTGIWSSYIGKRQSLHLVPPNLEVLICPKLNVKLHSLTKSLQSIDCYLLDLAAVPNLKDLTCHQISSDTLPQFLLSLHIDYLSVTALRGCPNLREIRLAMLADGGKIDLSWFPRLRSCSITNLSDLLDLRHQTLRNLSAYEYEEIDLTGLPKLVWLETQDYVQFRAGGDWDFWIKI